MIFQELLHICQRFLKEALTGKTLTELKAIAKTAGIKGYSTMKKDELISALS